MPTALHVLGFFVGASSSKALSAELRADACGATKSDKQGESPLTVIGGGSLAPTPFPIGR